MSEIPKTYEPAAIEAKWYDIWEKNGFFHADPKSPKPAYSIVIPPPNVTGVLTLGHVLNNTIQDILARRARMTGHEVLWLPGTDHAGIATQNVVEKTLRKEGVMKHRDDLGREALVAKIWEWREKYGGIILKQLRALGASCDWSRTRFTMDEDYSRCVSRVFVDLYKKGLIYRGKRMVNWCPGSLTALSDEEVVMKEQSGVLYYFKVEVVEQPGRWLTIATTRPETIPGDTAIAVNPKDPRYAGLIGKHARRPLPRENQASLPIIGDEAVVFDFGTGVLKVTPAHDKADCEIGQRHHLPLIDIMHPNGVMNDLAGADLAGLDRFAARKRAVEVLTDIGALEKEEPYKNNVGYSERADVPIEPRLSEQWFLKYPSVPESKASVEQTEIVKKEVRVVHVSGHEFAGRNIRELRKAALNYAREHGFLGKPFRNEDTGREIRAGRESLSHSFGNLGVANILAVAALPELIRTSIWFSSAPHQPPVPQFKYVHRFIAAASIRGELHSVYITAKEAADGTIYYDHKVKKVASGGKSLEAHLPKEKLDTQPAPDATKMIVRELLRNVNESLVEGKMRFYPPRWAKVYDHWMSNIQDWCISRQLWWGHRVPVFYNDAGLAALDKECRVVVQPWEEIGGVAASEMRRNAERIAVERGIVGGEFANDDTGWKILILKSSLEHAFANPGLANIKLVPALPALVRAAVFIGSERSKNASPDVLAVHTFVAALQLGYRFFRVTFTVKELADHRKLYDHQTAEVKKAEPDGKYPPAAHPLAEKLATRPASGSGVRVRVLFDDVNEDREFVRCQIANPGGTWRQDSDVLDTWFSSWLWPFATMGWPEKTDTLAKFYPTTDLVTGPDIIFFWVARMIMAGFEFMGEMPFRNVYFTSIIRDKQGRKLSKSLGNSPDPLDLMAKYGADGLRFGTMRSAPLGTDVLYDEKNIELGRNFCTKLWNAARFRQMQSAGQASSLSESDGRPASPSNDNDDVCGEIVPAMLTSDDKWILARLDDAIRQVSAALDEYRFSDATAVLYRFFWSEYCDWYVEASKAALGSAGVPAGHEDTAHSATNEGVPLRGSRTKPPGTAALHSALHSAALRENTLAVMDYVLSHTLRLFHPFLPFITEELWQGMGFAKDMPAKQGGETIMYAPWPKPFTADERAWFGLDETSDALAKAKYATVEAGRGLRRDFNLASNKRVRFVLKPAGTLDPHEANVIQLLLNAEPLDVLADYVPRKGTPAALTPLGELFLPLEGVIDVAAERERIGKELAKAEAELAKVRAKLADENFTSKVPAKVLEEHRQRERDWSGKLAQLAKMQVALGES